MFNKTQMKKSSAVGYIVIIVFVSFITLVLNLVKELTRVLQRVTVPKSPDVVIKTDSQGEGE